MASRSLYLKLTVFVLMCFVGPDSAELSANTVDDSIRHEINNSIGRALSYLADSQAEDGSWGHYPGVTGLVLTAFVRSPESIRSKYIPHIEAGYKYLLENTNEDGGIYPPFEPQLKAYNTSISILAFVSAQNPGFEQTILDARRYLLSLQADEEDGVAPDSSTYGGIGYNKDERSDISNMQFAIEAIRASDELARFADSKSAVDMEGEDNEAGQSNKLFWEKAITFLERCQNNKEYNDYEWSGDDGGFVYYPGNSKAGGTTSYGGMTYAGMKSFIHAGLSPDDKRVQAAYHWIRGNYTVDENPELGQQGLFYYYNVMAKALALYGEDILVDTSGTSHDWRADLSNKLLTIQSSDGSWVNENGRWWENNPDLVTAYCVMTLHEITR